jgi:hypothetical protein
MHAMVPEYHDRDAETRSYSTYHDLAWHCLGISVIRTVMMMMMMTTSGVELCLAAGLVLLLTNRVV